MGVDFLMADKAFDADKRVITVLANKNKVVFTPPKANQKIIRTCDRDLYKAPPLDRDLLSQNLSSSAPSPPVTIKPPGTS
jgi:hypothetical protein